MRSALYYPNVMIDNEALVKTGLLLWDRLEFIAPWNGFRPNYRNKQIARAMELIGAAHRPNVEEQTETHARLKDLMGRRLPPQFYRDKQAGPERESRIYAQKLLPESWKLLTAGRLARQRSKDSNYSLTEPASLMIMSVLADSCAGTTKSRVTDLGAAYATLAGLLGNMAVGGPTKKADAHEHLVAIGLNVIDAPKLDLATLIAFREREAKSGGYSLSDLRHRYIASLETYVQKVTEEKSRKSDAEEIKRQYESDMIKDLQNLRTELGFAKKDALLSKEILVTAIAAFGTVASWACGLPVDLPQVATWSGAPVAIGGLLAARNRYLGARHAIIQKHPMAYLYELKGRTSKVR